MTNLFENVTLGEVEVGTALVVWVGIIAMNGWNRGRFMAQGLTDISGRSH